MASMPAPFNVTVPVGWEPRVSDSNRVYFVNMDTEETTWTDPRCPLPAGWEERKNDGVSFFLHGGSNKPDPREHKQWCALNDHALPEFVEPRLSAAGLVHFADCQREVTSWTDPRFALPDGWHERKDDDGMSYFVELRTGAKSNADPRDFSARTAAATAAPPRAGAPSPLAARKQRIDGIRRGGAVGRGRGGLVRAASDRNVRRSAAGTPTGSAGAEGAAPAEARVAAPSRAQASRVKSAPAGALMKRDWRDDFELIEKVARGGFGVILKVRDKVSGELFVVKSTNLAKADRTQRASALREIELHAALAHPNIVAFVRGYQQSDSCAIVMELCDNGTLHHLVASRCTGTAPEFLPEEHVLMWFYELASAVACLHALGVVHNDIKPANVLLKNDAAAPSTIRVKLCDFGLALRAKDKRAPAEFWGTPEFTAPEVIDGGAPDRLSDIWSMGAVLYNVLALHPPFQATIRTKKDFEQNFGELAARVRKGIYEPLPGRYSAGAGALVESMLRKKSRFRPSAADMMGSDFLRPFAP